VNAFANTDENGRSGFQRAGSPSWTLDQLAGKDA